MPAILTDIAAAVGRALDPDAGGASSFARTITGYTDEGMSSVPIYGDTIRCETPCQPQFKAAADAMLADTTGTMLHGAVSADYARRWPDLDCPTLEDCAAFIAGVIPEPVPEAPEVGNE